LNAQQIRYVRLQTITRLGITTVAGLLVAFAMVLSDITEPTSGSPADPGWTGPTPSTPPAARLFIIDGAKALSKVIRRTFGTQTPIQRCRVHKARKTAAQAAACIGPPGAPAGLELDNADKAVKRHPELAPGRHEELTPSLILADAKQAANDRYGRAGVGKYDSCSQEYHTRMRRRVQYVNR
jgi:hypothetical protein